MKDKILVIEDDGDISHLICMNLNMSDQIRQQIEDLELLLGAMAHEMKTPLTNILGYADSLLHVRLTERQREQSLEAICRSAGRLNQMSGKLLQLVGLYENQEIETRPVDLEEVIQCVYEENKEKLDAKNVDFQILRRDNMRIDKTHLRKVTEPARQEKGAVVVQGDPLLLISLFGNLVSNSMKALEVGGRIQVILDENRQSVCVRDNGRGIPKEALPHVTKAFYMADKSRSRRQQGSGLGLALAERIVKAHHGEMEIESRMGEGTEVTVTFGDMRQERSKNDKEKAGR
ncbi:MAG: HAMP domain-containing histidine kinase [Hungatella sp.]|nr:HAMP domain-containing histidine kinase [Hungatella sp.]